MALGQAINANLPELDIMPHEEDDNGTEKHFKDIILLMSSKSPEDRPKLVSVKINLHSLIGNYFINILVQTLINF